MLLPLDLYPASVNFIFEISILMPYLAIKQQLSNSQPKKSVPLMKKKNSQGVL